MKLSDRMTAYVAPDGYLYDWADPHYATINEVDGTQIQTEEHLYVKYLYLGKLDNIENYKIVKDPKAGK